ncbi:MAG: FG-GAP repeat protein [Nannocystaceae bacterium]|nr:integrin alpha [bacterium]
MRRTLATTALLPPLLLPATTVAAGLTGTATPSMAAGDFDGDTLLDRAFGYPQANGTEGVVKIVYGSQVIEIWNRDAPGVLGADATGNNLGDSIAVGDFDRDGYDDLAIGVPGDDTGTGWNIGTVNILYGSSSGITGSFDQLYSQDTPGIANSEESYDGYGEFLQAGDFDCDGHDDLAIGIPQENLNSGTNGGAVNVIYGSSGGLSALDDFFHQNTSGVTGSVQAHDNFGASLLAANFTGNSSGGYTCDDLIVGVPGEDIGSADVGAMQLFPRGTDRARDRPGRLVSPSLPGRRRNPRSR